MSPTDQAARDTIATQTDRNLFVVAGAGSGKTSSLISRIATLVIRDGVRLRNIAAVTFTEKAGAELRDRLRAEFERARRAASTPAQAERAERALDELDLAAIGTLHSFAQRILLLHPIEAGLPPKLDVLDEVGSSIAQEEQWQHTLLELLEDEQIRPALQRALLSGSMDQLESLFKALTNDWDLIESHVLAEPPPPLQVSIEDALRQAAAEVRRVRAACASDADRLLARLDAALECADALDADDDLACYQALLAAPALARMLRDDGLTYLQVGSAANWKQLDGGLDEAKGCYETFRAEAIQAGGRAKNVVLQHLTHWIAGQVLGAADQRRQAGELIFHDLLVLARRVLRESPAVAGALSRRYTHLLLDEFQDTDPIQIELAVRIAGGAGGVQHAGWQDIAVPDGSLFVVGDPKQSIYRFRRADIALYLEVQEWFADRFGSDSIIRLETNFRSVLGVLEWVNRSFGELIVFEPGRQPGYDPLRAVRPPLPPPWSRQARPAGVQAQSGGETPALPESSSREAEPTEAAVTYLGWEQHGFAHTGNSGPLRDHEAADVAAVITRAIAEGWPVQEVDPLTGQAVTRSIQRSDIAVLVPARTSLPMLRKALDEARIPYRAEASSLVYQGEEIVELLLAAQAVADPSDQFALVMTLRSSLFGLGDDDLWRWKQAGGSFSLRARVEDDARRSLPVFPALEYLRKLSFEASRVSPADLLERLLRDRRAYELVADSPDAADRWRRFRFVVDQARAWSQNAHGGIRAYLEWARRQMSETARVYESILPETDLDAVRVLTVHAAKGLEYPMVILSGLTALPNRRPGVRLMWTPGGYALLLSADLQTTNFTEAEPLDEQMSEAERRRLLYVAATRARDHLVVSLHRAENTGRDTSAEVLFSASPDDPALASVFAADEVALPDPTPPTVAPPPETREVLTARLGHARRLSARPPSQSASGLEGSDPEVALAVTGEEDERVDLPLAKDQRDLDTPSYSKGRDATAIGIAVHAVLQTIDLRTGAGLDALVELQCLAGGVPQHAAEVSRLVRRALDSEVVRTAVSHQFWRESFLAMTTAEGQLVEGYADLIYRDDDGRLVVVDYKTDTIRSEAALAERTAFYAPQLRAYADMIRAATSADVTAQPLFLDAVLAGAQEPDE